MLSCTLWLTLRPFTVHTLTERAALRKELELTRERGYSMDREENEAGIFCFGAAIRGHRGAPVAAISVSTLLFRQRENPEQAYVAPLLDACAATCKSSGDECERHAHLHEHCRVCAEACRRCEQACRELLAAIS